jgi:CheY-like chemotaxis protein
MNLLLISDSPQRAVMLMQIMQQLGLSGEIRRMRPTPGAVACARRSGRYRRAVPHDFILFDFSEPDERCLSIVSDIAFDPNQASAPVILLTSSASERLLDSDRLGGARNSMFAPTGLSCFLKKMRQHSRRRFLRALCVMSDLGPVLVRLPGFFLRPADEISSRQVA